MSSTQPKYFLDAHQPEYWAKGVPILMYHKVGRPRFSPKLHGAHLYVGRGLFERQLNRLRATGFDSGTLSDATSSRDNTARKIVLTFDDGFENVFLNALAPMQRHGFRGMLYVIHDLIGKTNIWEQPEGSAVERLMDESQIREWLAAGHSIGAHTLTHPHLSRLSREAAREEIVASKKRLEDRLGIPIEHFCYPYGDHSDETVELVAEAGYQTATTTKIGLNTEETPAYRLRRYMVRYPKKELFDWFRWLLGILK